MKITAIQQAKKNENRVNVYLDDNFWVGLDKNELISFGLFKDKEISEAEKQQIEHSSSITKIMFKAINYVGIRPRSEKEMKDYLFRKEVDGETTAQILQKLREKNLLSDEEFAQWLVQGRLNSGRYGEMKIRAELMRKGVNKSIIDRTLAELIGQDEKENMEEKALEFAKKALNSIKFKDKFDRKNKLLRRLVSKGYSFELSSKVAKEVLE